MLVFQTQTYGEPNVTFPIDPSGRIATMVRTALAAQQKKDKGRGGGVYAQRDGSEDRSSDLAALVGRRVATIAPDDPERKQKVFRAFLEATLLAELGESLINDPRFRDMVDAVQEQMEADPQISLAIDQAVGILVTPPAAP